jgi:hypothetical protein
MCYSPHLKISVFDNEIKDKESWGEKQKSWHPKSLAFADVLHDSHLMKWDLIIVQKLDKQRRDQTYVLGIQGQPPSIKPTTEPPFYTQTTALQNAALTTVSMYVCIYTHTRARISLLVWTWPSASRPKLLHPTYEHNTYATTAHTRSCFLTVI